MLVTLMIRPQRCFSIEPITAWESRNGPVRLVLSTSSQSARFMRIINWSRVTPALFTRMSILPKRARTAFTPALISSSLATSILKTSALAALGGDLRSHLLQLLLVAGAQCDFGSRGGQHQRASPADSLRRAGYQRNAAFHSCHLGLL